MQRITRAALMADPIKAIFDAVHEGAIEIVDGDKVFLRLEPCGGPDILPMTLAELQAEVANS